MKKTLAQNRICVVIPAYRVKSHLLGVVNSIGPEVTNIIVVDDACPEKSGEYLALHTTDPRVEIIFHKVNLGVGGAVKTGYVRALELKSTAVVKIDGDGQMDPSKIHEIILPILEGTADYTKGNRFFDVEAIQQMPKLRIFGNLVLSFLTKLSSGYWNNFDPNNGFTAVSNKILSRIPLSKIDNGYFFESDMLFRLNLVGARVTDVNIPARYKNEKSNLKVRKVLFEFPIKHLRNIIKRIIYTYYLRDFNIASIELPLGLALTGFGTILGLVSWIRNLTSGNPTATGTSILVAMSVLAGLQFVLAFISYDTNSSNKS